MENSCAATVRSETTFTDRADFAWYQTTVIALAPVYIVVMLTLQVLLER